MSSLEELAQRLINAPDTVKLFRGESAVNRGGLHFTTDRVWALQFGTELLTGHLPRHAVVHLLTPEDFELAAALPDQSDDRCISLMLLEKRGADALLGHDPRNSAVLDVIVHPRHLDRFSRCEPMQSEMLQ